MIRLFVARRKPTQKENAMMKARMVDDEALLKELNAHPQIKARVASLLSAVADAGGDLKKADEAEQHMIEEMRRMGQEAMQAWAEGQVEKTERALREEGPVQREGKKNYAGTRHSAI
jgi:hypothetical protein